MKDNKWKKKEPKNNKKTNKGNDRNEWNISTKHQENEIKTIFKNIKWKKTHEKGRIGNKQN